MLSEHVFRLHREVPLNDYGGKTMEDFQKLIGDIGTLTLWFIPIHQALIERYKSKWLHEKGGETGASCFQ